MLGRTADIVGGLVQLRPCTDGRQTDRRCLDTREKPTLSRDIKERHVIGFTSLLESGGEAWAHTGLHVFMLISLCRRQVSNRSLFIHRTQTLLRTSQ